MILLFINFFLYIQSFLAMDVLVEAKPISPVIEKAMSPVDVIYSHLDHCINQSVFQEAYAGVQKFNPQAEYLAIADLSQGSEQQRFYIIDLNKKEIVLQTWVAHGKNSGDNYAHKFSNTMSSHMSSKGFLMIGETFESPKHGTSFALEGLQKGINDRARDREIIMHGADYVSEAFIEANGRCGRSYGCPALPREEMKKALEILTPGSILYIHS